MWGKGHIHTHTKLYCLPILWAPHAPCLPLRSEVTAHEWRVNPGRICSLAPWSVSILKLTRCFWKMPEAARRDGWSARHWLMMCPLWLMGLTQWLLIHRSNWCTLTIRPPYCPKEQDILSRCWRVAAWEHRLHHWVKPLEVFSLQHNDKDRGLINALVGV